MYTFNVFQINIKVRRLTLPTARMDRKMGITTFYEH